jgi:hypothetical protein
VAGTLVHITFAAGATRCGDLVQALRAFARRRLIFQRVGRLEWKYPVNGDWPSDWHAAGVEPADLGLSPDDWDVDFASDRQPVSLEEAANQWPLGPWLGLGVAWHVPPGRDGFPPIYGACWWRIWVTRGIWRHSAALEYPTSSVGRDERWAPWLARFERDAVSLFGGD